MEPIEAYYKIREACLRRPELKYKDPKFYNKEIDEISFKNNRFYGFCYVATHAFCKLIPEAVPYTFGNKDHYYAKIGDKIWDLTAEQFNFILPYETGRRVPRRGPTKRVKLLLEEVNAQ